METDGWAVSVPVGYQVGGWQVSRPIATGSWGSVYEARRVIGAAPEDGAPDRAALKPLPTGTLTPRQLVVQAESSVDCEGVRNPRGDPGDAPDDTEVPGGVLPASQGGVL
ncbi:MAG: hypothetical protein ACRDZ4_14235, partial [Egibacteraceae bacterium]